MGHAWEQFLEMLGWLKVTKLTPNHAKTILKKNMTNKILAVLCYLPLHYPTAQNESAFPGPPRAKQRLLQSDSTKILGHPHQALPSILLHDR